MTQINVCIANIKCTISTKISSFFPKQGDQNAKRTEKHIDIEQGKTKHEAHRSVNYRATENKNNIVTPPPVTVSSIHYRRGGGAGVKSPNLTTYNKIGLTHCSYNLRYKFALVFFLKQGLSLYRKAFNVFLQRKFIPSLNIPDALNIMPKYLCSFSMSTLLSSYLNL